MIVYVVVILMCVEMCYLIARRKGLPRARWLVLGAVFGPLAVLAALFAPSSGDKKSNF